MLLLTLSLFFTEPAPLDMPRAESYRVSEDGAIRLEDRYDRLDLWVSQTVIGRWIDDEGRMFTLAGLETEPPAADEHAAQTRTDYAKQRVPMKRIRADGKFPRAFRRAIGILADCPLAEDRPRPSRQLPHGYKDVDYWQHPTNYASIVCAFRPEKSERWYLAVWNLAEDDDYVERMRDFDEQFLRKEFPAFRENHPDLPAPNPPRRMTLAFERELLRADARRSIAAYDDWHFSDSEEFVVLDDLPTRDFANALTNEFATMRARYVATLPTHADVSNVLCVARVYASRDEYLEALETDGMTNMLWSAAYWSPQRRELVAYLPNAGEERLLETVRHEAFHQYLSYATTLIPTSPWLNEGYAQYFEQGVEDPFVDPADLAACAGAIPSLLLMDYDEFYAGTDRARALKYRLALSLAYFIEKGAPKVRFEPFKNLKRDYLDALLRTEDMRKATGAAFKDADTLKLFVSEWTKFWKNQ